MFVSAHFSLISDSLQTGSPTQAPQGGPRGSLYALRGTLYALRGTLYALRGTQSSLQKPASRLKHEAVAVAMSATGANGHRSRGIGPHGVTRGGKEYPQRGRARKVPDSSIQAGPRESYTHGPNLGPWAQPGAPSGNPWGTKPKKCFRIPPSMWNFQRNLNCG